MQYLCQFYFLYICNRRTNYISIILLTKISIYIILLIDKQLTLENTMKVTNDFNDANGTSRIGHIKSSYKDLVSVLGDPVESDGYKSSGEWVLKSNTGNVYTIYDWKATVLYDEDYPSIEEFRSQPSFTFNVGGNAGNDLSELYEFFKQKGLKVS